MAVISCQTPKTPSMLGHPTVKKPFAARKCLDYRSLSTSLDPIHKVRTKDQCLTTHEIGAAFSNPMKECASSSTTQTTNSCEHSTNLTSVTMCRIYKISRPREQGNLSFATYQKPEYGLTSFKKASKHMDLAMNKSFVSQIVTSGLLIKLSRTLRIK